MKAKKYNIPAAIKKEIHSGVKLAIKNRGDKMKHERELRRLNKCDLLD